MILCGHIKIQHLSPMNRCLTARLWLTGCHCLTCFSSFSFGSVQTVKDGPERWRAKKLCCFPVWFLTLCIILAPLVFLVLLLIFDLPKLDMPHKELLGQVDALEALAIAAFGLPAVTALRLAFLIIKHLIFNEDRNIRTEMDNPKISSQLGFMNEVRKEMCFLSGFVRFMEVFEQRRIRVVLQITNLDRCPPGKVVAVLNAINILLSDEESPFISILAANSSVLVQKVNLADGCFGKEDRGHALLSRIVTLIFTVPPLCDESKRGLFTSLAGDSKVPEDKMPIRNKHRIVRSSSAVDFQASVVEIAENNEIEMKEAEPLIDKTTGLDINEEEVDMLVRTIQRSGEGKLSTYMSDDALSLRRVINSIRVTVIIMKASKGRLPEPEHVAAWVVLADQWPCRLSWIIQCAEDARQRADIDGNGGADHDSKSLWDVFSESRRELYVMRAHIEDLLEQDGDPEMFEKFLTVDFQFTVKDLKSFEAATVNLDHSVRKELAQIRGTARLKGSGWVRNAAPLPMRTIINMNTQDVCEEVRSPPCTDTHLCYTNNDTVVWKDPRGGKCSLGCALFVKPTHRTVKPLRPTRGSHPSPFVSLVGEDEIPEQVHRHREKQRPQWFSPGLWKRRGPEAPSRYDLRRMDNFQTALPGFAIIPRTREKQAVDASLCSEAAVEISPARRSSFLVTTVSEMPEIIISVSDINQQPLFYQTL